MLMNVIGSFTMYGLLMDLDKTPTMVVILDSA